MNPLEALKQKLKVKPTVEERKPVEVVIQLGEKEEKPLKHVKFASEEKNEPKGQQEKEQSKEKSNFSIIDKRDQGFDRDTLMKKLSENKLLKVTKSNYIDNYMKHNESRLKYKKRFTSEET